MLNSQTALYHETPMSQSQVIGNMIIMRPTHKYSSFPPSGSLLRLQFPALLKLSMAGDLPSANKIWVEVTCATSKRKHLVGGTDWTFLFPASEMVSKYMLVAQLCPTLCDPLNCSPPGSSVHEIFQARILKWVAFPFSKGSSQPRDWTQVSCTAGRFFTIWATREASETVGSQISMKSLLPWDLWD